MFVMILGNIAYADSVDMEYPSYLPSVEFGSNTNYFIVKDRYGEIRIFDFYKDTTEHRIYLELVDDGQNLYLYKRWPNRLYHYVLDGDRWVTESYDKSEMKIKGYEILYTNYELEDNATGEVIFPLKPPTLEEITGESVEKIPGKMAGMMRKMFPAGFGILLGIVLSRSLKVFYRYF